MSEIEIKEQIAVALTEDFGNIELTPFLVPITIGADVTPPDTYMFVTEVFLAFTDILDFGSTDDLYLDIDDCFGNNPFVQFNMSGPSTHHTLNPTPINLTLQKLELLGTLTNGDALCYVKGYYITILP